MPKISRHSIRAGNGARSSATRNIARTDRIFRNHSTQVFDKHVALWEKFKPLVSEYGSYVLVAISGRNSQIDTTDVLKSFPKGAKIVHRRFLKGSLRVDDKEIKEKPFEVRQADQEGTHQSEVLVVAKCFEERVSGDYWEILSIGVPRDKKSFLEKAFEAGHPRTMAIHLSDGVKEALNRNFAGEQYLLMKRRLAYISKWSKRAMELVDQERALHGSLPEHLKGILRGKRLLLMGEMLQDAGYPDQKLVSDICGGFSVSGWLQQSRVFGPILQHHWGCPCSLEQKTRLRVIDDCAVGGWNKTCGSLEKLRIHAIDEMAAFIAWTMSSIDRSIAKKMVGKTDDLTSAYKQFGISVGDRNLLRIATWNPEVNAVALLGVNALPSGATGSVTSFLCVAMAVWFLWVRCLDLVWTCFFDDYTLLSQDSSSASASFAAESLFKLLGIQYAQEGSKNTEFSKGVKTLGVLLNREGEAGAVNLGHTDARRQELRETLDSILSEGQVLTKTAESLRGRLQWFETCAFGRTAKSCLQRLGEISMCSGRSHRLTANDYAILTFLKIGFLRLHPYRSIRANWKLGSSSPMVSVKAKKLVVELVECLWILKRCPKGSYGPSFGTV